MFVKFYFFAAAPKVVQDLEDRTTTEGSECTFVVKIDGTPSPTVDWYILITFYLYK